MSDKYIEKIFLCFVVLSVLLHLAIFAVIVNLPRNKPILRPDPYMVELRDLPPSREEPARKRPDEPKRRVLRETAPKGETERDKVASLPPPRQEPTIGGAPRRQSEPGEMSLEKKPRGGDFFRQKETGAPDISRLYPSADKLARLEENYRKKYGQEVSEGDVKFLNSDDITLGSFLNRFEAAVYGVWRYPPEAARMGIEGVTPVKITFNRNGEIEKMVLLESSGSKILDDEVRRTLKAVGTIGPLPKGYPKETFNLIAFFHYGIVRGVIRGTLY